MATTGDFCDQRIRGIRRRFWTRNWHLLGLFLLYVLALGALLAVTEAWLLRRWIDRGLVVAFIIGQSTAAAAGLIIALLGRDGARNLRDGREAEAWTQGILKRLRRRGWYAAHNVVTNDSDIDHVLIGPHGAIAIETKFRNDEWQVTDSSIVQVGLDGRPHPRYQELGQALSRAERLKGLLLAGGVRTEVLPVLVLWGPRVTGESGVKIKGVLVGLGSHPEAWLDQLESVPLEREEIRLARRAVELRKAGKWVDKPTPPSRTDREHTSSTDADSGAEDSAVVGAGVR